MKESIFWKLATVAALVGVFYVGHGLHEDQAPAWDLFSSASADEQPAIAEVVSWQQLWDGKEATWIIAARRKVPGGRLVTVQDTGITFYPDPAHDWDIQDRLGDRR